MVRNPRLQSVRLGLDPARIRHRHEGCKLASTPKTNKAFWLSKFDQNIARDRRNVSELKSLGWSVGIIWECSVRNGTFIEAELEELITNRGCWEV